ncbi:hypothetical protein CR513_53329, partial [Mucuna pruriens]
MGLETKRHSIEVKTKLEDVKEGVPIDTVGSSSLFQDDRDLSRPISKLHPSFIPGINLATHTTMQGDTFVYHIPKYLFVEFSGLKKSTSIIPPTETKVSPSRKD